MGTIIDRRLNPQGKSLENRQRFLRRAKARLMDAVRSSSAGRRIGDIPDGESVVIPSDSLSEPSFRKGKGGVRSGVLPGNKEYVAGDTIPKPDGGSGSGGPKASDSGDGEDGFRFVLTKEEFLDLFLEDLELPDLERTSLASADETSPARAGYSTSGTPSAMSVGRTMRNSMGRRVALGRPSRAAEEKAARLLEEAISAWEQDGGDAAAAILEEARREVARIAKRRSRVPFVDPIDVRYNRFEQRPKPVVQAVMFCLMDVSGSMSEDMKDMAKRFFMLLYLFLERRYEKVELVFIRHTHEAQEVDEDTFFRSPQSGGTVVSTALDELLSVQKARYPVQDWNLYVAQASDGDNTDSDNPKVQERLSGILPMSRYYAYIEVGRRPRESDLWEAIAAAGPSAPGRLAQKRVESRQDIYPVFRELFSKERSRRVAPNEGSGDAD